VRPAAVRNRRRGAADRLIGLSWCRRISAPGPELFQALLERVNEDPSTNVRLAAVDILMQAGPKTGGRTEFCDPRDGPRQYDAV